MKLISKEEAISKIEQYSKRSCSIYVKTALKLLDETPTVESRPSGVWIDNSEDGYVECPFCHSATTCEDNIEELHFCWNCGAELRADMRGEE